jgi:hypothetical protein
VTKSVGTRVERESFMGGGDLRCTLKGQGKPGKAESEERIYLWAADRQKGGSETEPKAIVARGR